MITKEHRQEVISWSYVRVIAARCGFSRSSGDLDYGIDLNIHEVSRTDDGYTESGFQIDAQLKSSTTVTLGDAGIQYDLDLRAYNILRAADLLVPRILLLLVLPQAEAEWTAQNEECLALRRCVYWLDLRGAPARKNKRAVRVSIPRVNVFSIESLTRLMGCVRRREPLC